MGDVRLETRVRRKEASSAQDAETSDVDRRRRRVAGASALTLSGAIAQAKLAVGPANDPYETEADQVADQVVRSLRGGSSGSADVDPGAEPAAQRVQRKASSIGAEGGTVDADTDRAIQSSRGGGTALPTDAREKMEGAFGADFSSIRVHEGAEATELSNRIQAKAFTVGSDVYFRDGVPDTNSSDGQHLLAHELTHTIQQGGAAAMRSADLVGRIRRSPARVQRLVSGKPRLPMSAYSLTGDKVDAASSAAILDPNKPVQVDDATLKNFSTDKDGVPPGWAKVVSATDVYGNDVSDGWVKLSLVTAEGDGADILEAMDEGVSPLGFMGDVADDLGSDGDDLLVGNQERDFGIAGDAGGTVSGLIGLAAAIQALGGPGSVQDKVEASMDLAGSAVSTATGIAGVVAKATDEAGKSKEAAGGLSMFGDIFEGIKSTYSLVKTAVDLAKNANEKSGQEKFEDTMGMVSNLIEMASSGVNAAKTFLETFTTAGPGAALTNSVPGLGIALGTVDLTVRAFALVKAMVQKHRMQKDKRATKENLEIEMPDGTKVKGQTGKKFEAATLYKKLVKKNENYPQQGFSPHPKGCTQKELDFLFRCDSNPEFQHYLMTKGLQYINKKRANRALLKIAVAMTKISGDVATLGGASAPVGIGLKAGALAIDVGASLFRKFKQHFRDKRAKKEKKGEEVGAFLNAFDSKKSTAAKTKRYNKTISMVFSMVVAASKLPVPAAPAKDDRFDQVIKYTQAMGISMNKVKALKDKPEELWSEMLDYMNKRE